MSDKPPLPPGILPNITDTDPPPVHEDTVAGPPAVVDIPHVEQKGADLTCTMGNWTNKPTGYAYQWQIDGNDVGDDAASYTPGPSDAGKAATCIVTATNHLGSTAAPPGGPLVVGAARRQVGSDRHPEPERHGHEERGERHK